jgi:hypothetical protein
VLARKIHLASDGYGFMNAEQYFIEILNTKVTKVSQQNI